MLKFKYTCLVISVLLIIIIQQATARSGIYTIYVLKNKSEKTSIFVEIADTESERETGLMFRYSMPRDNGMVFVFKEERRLSFWMKNTFIPLDIAYIDSNGIINEIYRMEPLDYSVVYPSKKPAMYALEVNAGWFANNGIKPGMKLDFNGCIGK